METRLPGARLLHPMGRLLKNETPEPSNSLLQDLTLCCREVMQMKAVRSFSLEWVITSFSVFTSLTNMYCVLILCNRLSDSGIE